MSCWMRASATECCCCLADASFFGRWMRAIQFLCNCALSCSVQTLRRPKAKANASCPISVRLLLLFVPFERPVARCFLARALPNLRQSDKRTMRANKRTTRGGERREGTNRRSRRAPSVDGWMPPPPLLKIERERICSPSARLSHGSRDRRRTNERTVGQTDSHRTRGWRIKRSSPPNQPASQLLLCVCVLLFAFTLLLHLASSSIIPSSWLLLLADGHERLPLICCCCLPSSYLASAPLLLIIKGAHNLPVAPRGFYCRCRCRCEDHDDDDQTNSNPQAEPHLSGPLPSTVCVCGY